ncbi:MAG: hypothetical protein ACE5IM_09830, partial [Nitrospinota bacterium]
MPKPYIEFTESDSIPWEPIPGYPEGAFQKILSQDEEGNRTRLLRFEAGFETTEAFVHEFWEEVLVLEGGLIEKEGTRTALVAHYACRPPAPRTGLTSAPWGARPSSFTTTGSEDGRPPASVRAGRRFQP